MYHPIPVPASFTALLQRQHGAVTVEQARACGLTRQQFRRLCRSWTKLGRGLYIAGDVTWHAFAWACVLRGGDAAGLGGSAACYVHGLIRRPPDVVTVWTQHARPALVHGTFRSQFRRKSVKLRGEPPTVGIEDALLQHASEADEHALVEAVTRAIAERRTTGERLRRWLGRQGRQPQRALLDALATHSDQGIHSVLEWRFHIAVELLHGLTGLERQVTPNGKGRVDVLFREYGLVVELDGREFHDADRDARRDNEHALQAGLVTLRFTWRQVVHESCAVARVVQEALLIRGWAGPVGHCDACRPANPEHKV